MAAQCILSSALGSCPPGQFLADDYFCQLCPAGYYCPTGTAQCQCTQDVSFSVGGQAACTVCAVCVAGTRALHACTITSNTDCSTQCGPGKYAGSTVIDSVSSVSSTDYQGACPAQQSMCNIDVFGDNGWYYGLVGYCCDTNMRQTGAKFLSTANTLGGVPTHPQVAGQNNALIGSMRSTLSGGLAFFDIFGNRLLGLGSYESLIPMACTPGGFAVGAQGGYGNGMDAQSLKCMNFCDACPVGKFSSGYGAVACTDCRVCAAGTYKLALCSPTADTPCVSCTPGVTFSNTPNSFSCSTCLACPAGTYRLSPCTVTADTLCGSCTPGFTFSTGPGSLSCSACSVCPAGTYRLSACSVTADTRCVSCTAGSNFSTAASSPNCSACSACPAGTYRRGNCTVAANTDCAACAAGLTYSVANNSNACSACQTCVPGKYVQRACTVTSNQVCQNCSSGSTYSVLNNTATCASCTVCGPGTFRKGACVVATDTVCQSCTPGSNFSNGTNVGNCTPCTKCPPGSYAGSLCTAAMDTVCQVCPAGSFTRLAGATACQSCAAGSTYAVSSNSTSCQNCTVCAPGTFQTSTCTPTANRVCSQCLTGKFAAGYGATACQPWKSTCGGGSYMQSPGSSASDVVCAPCKTSCPAGNYITGTGCAGTSLVDTITCTACVAVCPSGYYPQFLCTGSGGTPPMCLPCNGMVCPSGQFVGSCPSTAPAQCQNCSSCPAGYYMTQCGGLSGGQCAKCTNCTAIGLMQRVNCSALANAVCVGAPCSPVQPCVGNQFCSYAQNTSAACPYRVKSTGATHFLCSRPKTAGVCMLCPDGWRSAGAFCEPCPAGVSCNADGSVACQGSCDPGWTPYCQESTGKVACQRCTVDWQGVTAANMVVTQGGVVARTDLCVAYFRCMVGFVLNVTEDSRLQCVPCTVPEANQSLYAFYSHGLALNDPYSCLYQNRSALGWGGGAGNTQGVYGAGRTSCPLFMTSQPGVASVIGDCLACPPAPANGVLVSGASCDFACNAGYEPRAAACVSSRFVDCTGDGLVKNAATGLCGVTPMPWSRPGSANTGGFAVGAAGVWNPSPEGWMSQYVFLDPFDMLAASRVQLVAFGGPWASGGVGTTCLNATAIASQPALYWPNGTLKTPLPAVRDLQFAAFFTSCDPGNLEYYTFYMGYRRDYVPMGFMQRAFGNDNRWMGWQIMPNSSVVMEFRFPGKVCSFASLQLGAQSYGVAAFCNASMLAYVDLNQRETICLTAGCPATLGTGTAQLVYRFMLLIGSDTPGSADGMRDEARFGQNLAVSGGGASRDRLWVADTDNCRIAEVVVQTPGAYTTRALTLFQGCYQPSVGFPYQTMAIPRPRLLVPVLQPWSSVQGGGWSQLWTPTSMLFVTDTHVVHMDLRLRVLNPVCSLRDLPFGDIMGVGVVDPVVSGSKDWAYSVIVYGKSQYVLLTALQAVCPLGSISFAGGACRSCGVGNFARNNTCVGCNASLACPVGQRKVECAATEDARCVLCDAGLAQGLARYRWLANCVPQQVAPCPANWYALPNGDCARCQAWAESPANSTGAQACVCVGNGVYSGAPADLLALALTTGNGSCVVQSAFRPGQGDVSNVSGTIVDLRCLPEECPRMGCYLAFYSPRICWPCPGGQVGLNGLWCAGCPVGEIPTAERDECVCGPPSYANMSDGLRCYCPGGYTGVGGVCVPCPANTRSLGAVFVWSNVSACEACPNGTYSGEGAGECKACPVGQYRTVDMQGCQPCPLPNWWARCAGDVSSCVECVESGDCGLGVREVPCPINASRVWCDPCPPLQFGQRWVIVGGLRAACQVECEDGLWMDGDGSCQECTDAPCPYGTVVAPCSRFRDAWCGGRCLNLTMPAENAVWGAGCAWLCADGYRVVSKRLAGWTQYLCIPVGGVPWYGWEGRR